MDFLTDKLEQTALATASSENNTFVMLPHDVITHDSEQLDSAIDALRKTSVLALDCEGVNLGRAGKICLVQLATREHCFLFDVHEVTKTCKMVVFLSEVIGDKSVTKVIHDCRQDADALFHHLGIRLQNVHDTQRWDHLMNGSERNLNKTLEANGLVENSVRDGSVYNTNAAYWAERPLTTTMIEWACGDVQTLFALYDLQLQRATEEQRVQASDLSTAAATEIVQMVSRTVYLDPAKMGKFIGKGGGNLRALKEKHPGSSFHTSHTPGEVVVYAKDNVVLNGALKAIKKFMP
jgi:ribonuclease D